MLFELLTGASALAISGYATFKKNNATNKDGEKILRIAENCGLGKKDDRLRLFRKNYNKKEKYTEYVFKIPLGLELKDFTDKYGKFKDGLNNKSAHIVSLADFKKLKFDRTLLKQVQAIFNKRIQLDKQITMEYDGMLIMRVYDEGLKGNYPITEELMRSVGKWKVALGKGLGTQIVHDFEKQPHILIGGATDMGKSNILNLIIVTLLLNHADDVEFTLIDLKGGLEFGVYENLPQVKNFATNTEEAFIALNNVVVDMEQMFERLRKAGKKNVVELGYKKRHFVIVDESAELASAGEQDKDEKKLKVECENLLKDIARRGRSAGIRLLYCTQYPTTETVSSQVKRNLITRICLAVDTATASTVVLDEGGAELLNGKGRAIYKNLRCQEMQAYHLENKTTDNVVKTIINIMGPREVRHNAPRKATTPKTGGSYTTEFEEVGLPNP